MVSWHEAVAGHEKVNERSVASAVVSVVFGGDNGGVEGIGPEAGCELLRGHIEIASGEERHLAAGKFMACLCQDGGVVVATVAMQALRVLKVDRRDNEGAPSRNMGYEHDGSAWRNDGDGGEGVAEVAVDEVQGGQCIAT